MAKPKIREINEKEILQFVQSCRIHLLNMDKVMEQPSTFDRGKAIAKQLNDFNLALDSFLHFQLKMPFSDFSKMLNKSYKLPKVK